MVFSLFRNSNDHTYPLTWVTPQLAVGHAPMSYPELDSLKEQGIRAIMNLCLEMEELANFQREQGFEVYYLPILDEDVPELEELEKGLDWLDEAIYLGKKVLIHCRHGIGRTGTVVYSYLLRKGLGSRMAKRTMRGIRSQPTEHPQKRLLRTYGKKEGTLEFGEPSLDPGLSSELEPIFERLKGHLQSVESTLSDSLPRCGREHSQCCYGLVTMSLVEAAYLQKGLNSELTSSERLECIQQARIGGSVLQTISEQLSSSETPAVTEAFERTTTACPLLKDGQCQLFAYRPLQCRLSDLPGSSRTEQPDRQVAELSKQVMNSIAGGTRSLDIPDFNLFDVVSGLFVQDIFDLLAGKHRAAR
jgi:hypothetical protein